MLGERIGEAIGKVVLQRVLPNPGGPPKLETTFQETGTMFGVPMNEIGTYTAVLRPDGSLFGEGNGVVTGKDGDAASWTGQGVGALKKDGAVSFRGAIYVQTASPKWANLNGIAVLFEFDIDAQGATRGTTFEWK